MAELNRVRSMLFMPASRADMIAKIPRLAPDVAVVDLEDAVPADAKDAARDIAAVAWPLGMAAASIPSRSSGWTRGWASSTFRTWLVMFAPRTTSTAAATCRGRPAARPAIQRTMSAPTIISGSTECAIACGNGACPRAPSWPSPVSVFASSLSTGPQKYARTMRTASAITHPPAASRGFLAAATIRER